MAFSAVPFALQNVPINADTVRQAISSLIPNTGGIVQTGDLAVTQTSTASMGCLIGVGRAWIPGTNIANLTGQTYSKQALYFALNDANITATLATSDPTNPRIDTVYVAIEDANYAGTNNDVSPTYVVTGTPNATPVAPTAPNNSITLATIAVGAGVSSITNANITINPNLQYLHSAARFIVTNFARVTGTDSTFTSANTQLIAGTITNAPAGWYRIDGQCSLYASGGAAVGYVFTTAGPTTVKRRWDVTDTSHPTSPYAFQMYNHPGGNLTIAAGYSLSAGTAVATAQSSGLTDVTATWMG